MQKIRCVGPLVVFAMALNLSSTAQPRFKKHIIASRFVSEGVATSDVNRDGQTDVLAGHYWFEAPAWTPHLLHADTLNPVPGYSTTFLNYSLDVNNDGWLDLIRFDQPGGVCVWYENSKSATVLWKRHLILPGAGIENPAFVDVDSDGRADIICNDTLLRQVIWLKAPSAKKDTVWKRFVISDEQTLATNRYTHGLGWGDVNKDGRNDVLIRSGWWECPNSFTQAHWPFHAADYGEECANMYVCDVDEDGDEDVISSSAHGYGVWWHEQTKKADGKLTWIQHTISKAFSQSHGLLMKDINGDGQPDLITGKRYRAHNDGDAGAFEPAVLYWFQFKPGKPPLWTPHLIDDGSGIGLSFVADDLNQDGLTDVIISNKKGVFFFEQTK